MAGAEVPGTDSEVASAEVPGMGSEVAGTGLVVAKVIKEDITVITDANTDVS